MNRSEMDSTVWERITETYNRHMSVSAELLRKNGELLPMLLLPEEKQIVSLQGANGGIDVDKARLRAIEILKERDFSCAVFSYSTQIVRDSGKAESALKTCVFTPDGTETVFFAPFSIKGIFKKSISFEETVIAEVNENVFV